MKCGVSDRVQLLLEQIEEFSDVYAVDQCVMHLDGKRHLKRGTVLGYLSENHPWNCLPVTAPARVLEAGERDPRDRGVIDQVDAVGFNVESLQRFVLCPR